MRKTVCVGTAVLSFLLGLAIFLYPCVQGWAAERKLEAEVISFTERVEIPREPVNKPERIPQNEDEAPPRAHESLYTAMQKYNEALCRTHQKDLTDARAYEQPSFELGAFGLDSEIFGVLTIEKLELEMPIFLGATYDHMADGVAHLSQTSLPIGGSNTNSVLAGHRGWGGAKYFRYITDLVQGDEVVISNLWETLHYTVCETQIIAPDDVEAIHIRPGRELITLLTCHPYASGGRQRYLVICERNYDEGNQNASD